MNAGNFDAEPTFDETNHSETEDNVHNESAQNENANIDVMKNHNIIELNAVSIRRIYIAPVFNRDVSIN